MLKWIIDLFKPKQKINIKAIPIGSIREPFDIMSNLPKFNPPPLDGYVLMEKQEMNSDQLQTQLMQAVSYHFDKDAVRPGVVTSSLRNGKIYASVVRYGKQFAKGKQVVCKAEGTELKEVMQSLSVKFLNVVTSQKSPVDSLKELVADKSKKS